MKANRLDDVFKEALDFRSRVLLEDWSIAKYDAARRIFDLEGLLEKYDDSEIFRHAIVSSIAALQTFHRAVIVQVTNQGEPYRDRAAERFTEKFSLKDSISAISGNTISFGELAAHLAPCNSLTDVISWLDALLGESAKSLIRNAVKPEHLRNGVENPQKLVVDVDDLFATIDTAFRIRHIYAHEAAVNFEIEKTECRKMVSSIGKLMQAIDAALWVTVFKNHPLTQIEMTVNAIAEARKARSELAVVLKKTRRIAQRDKMSAWLRNNHRLWTEATRDWYKNTYSAQQGTIWPSLANADMAETYRARARQLKSWNDAGSPGDEEMESWLNEA